MSNYTNLTRVLENNATVKPQRKNYFKSKYADYNDVVSKNARRLRNGINVTIDTKTAIRTKLIHLKSGEVLLKILHLLEAAPNNPQTQGSGITYMKRYSYIAMLDFTCRC